MLLIEKQKIDGFNYAISAAPLVCTQIRSTFIIYQPLFDLFIPEQIKQGLQGGGWRCWCEIERSF